MLKWYLCGVNRIHEDEDGAVIEALVPQIGKKRGERRSILAAVDFVAFAFRVCVVAFFNIV